jgi:hypothetical protein
MKNIMIFLIMVALVCSTAFALDRNVPSDMYATIQSAITASEDGDTVIVAEGVYSGFGNTNLHLEGKAITLRGADVQDPGKTIIDCSQFPMTQGLIFNDSDTECVVEGFTISGATGIFGGAVNVVSGSPVIRNCVFTDNTAYYGGGAVFNDKGNPLFVNCVIASNTTNNSGGGIYTIMGGVEIVNCIIAGNYSMSAAAVYAMNSNVTIGESAVVENNSTDSPSTIYFFGTGNLLVENTIIWNNLEFEDIQPVYVGGQGPDNTAVFAYCNIQGLDQAVMVDADSVVEIDQATNINVDPEFVMEGSIAEDGVFIMGDYHLQETSPCINAGDPGFVAGEGEVDIDGQSRVSGTAVDIGVDEIQLEEALEVKVVILPRIINLNRKGGCVVGYIRPLCYKDKIKFDTKDVLLNDEISPVRVVRLRYGLIVKFKRSDVEKLVGDEKKLELTITGLTKDGLAWSGTDTVRIIPKRVYKKWHKKHYFMKNKQCNGKK